MATLDSVKVGEYNVSFEYEKFQDTHGCYGAALKYEGVMRDSNTGKINEDSRINGTETIVLNGPGESKLAKKVNRFLHFKFDIPKHRSMRLNPENRTIKHKKRKGRKTKYLLR